MTPRFRTNADVEAANKTVDDIRDDVVRNGRLVRCLQMIRHLDRRGDGMTIEEFRELFNISEDTVRRDLSAIEEAGLPLMEKQDGSIKRWRIAYDDKLRRVNALFDVSHSFMLILALNQGKALRGSPAHLAVAADLIEKIGSALSEKERTRFEQIRACCHSPEGGAYKQPGPDVIWMLVSSIIDRCVCKAVYRSMGAAEHKTSRILPLRIVVHDGAAYLRYWSLDENKPGTYHLHRLKSLDVLDEHAEVPKSFDQDAYERSAFRIYAGGVLTTFVLIFNAKVADLIRERFWHPTEQLDELSGGRVKLTFTCGDSIEVTRWIASWMDDVTVVSPRVMQDRLGASARVLRRRYPKRRAYNKKADQASSAQE